MPIRQKTTNRIVDRTSQRRRGFGIVIGTPIGWPASDRTCCLPSLRFSMSSSVCYIYAAVLPMVQGTASLARVDRLGASGVQPSNIVWSSASTRRAPLLLGRWWHRRRLHDRGSVFRLVAPEPATL